jgi:serine/threonine protein kinase
VLSPGDRFEGYIVDAIAGRGGSSAVYRAHEVGPAGRVIALKVLADRWQGTTERDRLRREYGYARRLSHPHVIPVYDAGATWLSMEFVAGGTVSTLPTLREKLEALRQIAEALDYIHTQGVVHCDVKPANILVARGFSVGGAFLVDFGSAQQACREPQPRASYVAASLPYAAPELLTGQPLDGAADEYSMACTAVEMITGTPPFTVTTQVGLTAAHLQSPVPQPSRQIGWLPRAFDSILAKAMAKDPQRRYRSCAEMVALITRVVRT